MQGLSPTPYVDVADPWRVVATEAGRYKRGISAMLHLYEGPRSDRSRITHLGMPDDLDVAARSFAFSAQLTPEAFRQPLQDLIDAIETALQQQDDAQQQARAARAQQQAAQAAGPAGGGIPMAQRFSVQPDGVWYDDGQTPPVWVCAELRVLGGTRDEHHDHHGHALAFKDRYGESQQWAMPLELLEDRREYRKTLRRLGLQMNSSKQGMDLLQAYLDLYQSQDKMLCVEKTGWHKDIYVLPDATYGQRAGQEQVVLQGLNHSVDGYRQAGDLETWKTDVAALCVGNTRLVFAVSMAFGAPLLSRLDVEGGGVHLRGQSSEGKTTVLRVAASVWGEPGRLELWRATANGLEGVASYHNDGLLLLDELKEIDPREAGATAYMLSNGSGKRRGRPEGGTRPRLTWHILFLSSGEISLETHVEYAGQRVHAGQDVRLVDLAAAAETGNGVFEDLHGHANGQVFADCLKRHAAHVYGVAGRAFLTELVDHLAEATTDARDMIDLFMHKQVPSNASGQVRRVALRFGLIAAAGELATDYGITGWTPGEATKAAKVCFDAWIKQRGGHTSGDEERAVAQVRLFFERYGEARFPLWDEDTPAQPSGGAADPPDCPKCGGTSLYGAAGKTCFACQGTGKMPPEKADQGPRVYDRAGLRKETNDGRYEFYVLREVFRKEVCKGYEASWVAKILVAHHLLLPSPDGNTMRKERLPKLGLDWVYRFTPEITGAAS
jgi:uncharacterized protein (DUF927 family)